MSDIILPHNMPDWIKKHTRQYLDDGEAGHQWDAREAGFDACFDTLLLFTTGRKSGNKVVLPLIYQPADDGGYCVIASKGGAPQHPAWFLNLQANPKGEIKVRNDEMNIIARVAEGQERQRLWQMMVNYYPGYGEYQKLTDREIPVVVLDPV
jgi:deazaflavin-dependent oxidoreductase (nitroreductase family)